MDGTAMTLIERLEAATEGSRELDAEIASHYGGLSGMSYETWEAVEAHAPHYTTSLDAAIQLVREGCAWGVEVRFGRLGSRAWVKPDLPFSEGNTPALALCIAALRAREDG